ncbi:MAG: MoaD family protein [Pseudomonadota bacterium]|nr:MoaD family protein [Pseudomonadota bacterium]
MANVTVRIPTPLRAYTQGAAQVGAEGATVGEVLQTLTRRHQGLGERILDADGQLRNFVNLYLGGRSVRSLDGLDTAVSDGDVLSIVPAVAGGEP